LILTLETKKNCLKNLHQPSQSKPYWIGLDFIVKVNQIKPNRILIYITFGLLLTSKLNQTKPQSSIIAIW